MKCIVHYPGYKDYSNIKPLTPNCTERILKAKEVRESIGGDHSHAAQQQKPYSKRHFSTVMIMTYIITISPAGFIPTNVLNRNIDFNR